MATLSQILTSPKTRLVACTLLAVLLCAAWWTTDVAFALHENAILQLVSMLGMLAWCGAFTLSLIFLCAEWPHLRYWTLIPLLVCLVSCEGGIRTTRKALRTQFTQQIPLYEAIIARMESGEISVTVEPHSITLPESDHHLAYLVLAQKDTNGVLTVEFLNGGGFPLKHSGYLYTSSGQVLPGSFFDTRWPFKWAMKPKWFRISD